MKHMFAFLLLVSILACTLAVFNYGNHYGYPISYGHYGGHRRYGHGLYNYGHYIHKYK
ncbi:unnamed protein product [Larinioides sclopetarius]|uniref:Uncharacterized protein n=1 Tax=Larinioides sclopetarius TaxID=280406 RepID=A0AAV2BWY8_9ARAC